MNLGQRRQQVIEVINEMFEKQDEAETMADLVKEGRKKYFHIVRSEEHLRGLAEGHRRSAMMLMKLKKEIEIEMKNQ